MRRRSFSCREDLYFAIKGYTEKLNREKVWETTSAPKPYNCKGYSATEVQNLILIGKLPPVPDSVFCEWYLFKAGKPSHTLGVKPIVKRVPNPPKRNQDAARLKNKPIDRTPSEVVKDAVVENVTADEIKMPEAPKQEQKREVYLPDFEPADREKLSKGESASALQSKEEKSADFTGGGVVSF